MRPMRGSRKCNKSKWPIEFAVSKWQIDGTTAAVLHEVEK